MCKGLAASVPNLYAIETLDSESKAQTLNDARVGMGILNVYLQVNTSGEDQKGGLIDEGSIYALADYVIRNCPHLYLKGLMTIGSKLRSFGSGENLDFLVRTATYVWS